MICGKLKKSAAPTKKSVGYCRRCVLSAILCVGSERNHSNGSAGAKPVRNPEREKPKWEDTITNRMLHWSYTPEQKEEVKKALAAGVPKATILTYFYPEVTVEKMSSYRNKH